MNEYFNNIDEVKIQNQTTGKKLHVNIIKPIKTKFGDNFYIYDKVNNGSFFGNSLLKSLIEKILDKLQIKDGYYVLNDNIDDILILKIAGNYMDKKYKRMLQKFDIQCCIDSDMKVNKTNKTLPLNDLLNLK